jgi:hypothetical protein
MDRRRRIAASLCLLVAATLAGAYLFALLPDVFTLVAALILAGLGVLSLIARPPQED